jgi:TonB-dependent starch-binding outer membrane protein SusC
MLFYRITFTCLLIFLFVVSCGQEIKNEAANKPDTLHNNFIKKGGNPALQSSEKEFNQGLINDPLQLIQGKLSGVLISKGGNNPNEGYKVRIRGISSLYMSSSPLLIIDGFPSFSNLHIDPLDISKISMIKDAASSAIYGLRSLAGVLFLETQSGKQPFTTSNYSAVELPNDLYPIVLNAKEFVGAGGSDLGSQTNWHDGITRKSFSNVTHISYGDKINNTEYNGSLSIRSVDGTLRNSGFNAVNFRFKFNHDLFNKRLNIGARVSAANRKSSFSFPEAFKYARIFNPTAPVFNSSGDYYQALTFDNFNPIGMVEQNINDGELKSSSIGLRANWQIGKDLKLNVVWGKEFQKNDLRRYISKKSFWQNAYVRNGLRDQTYEDLKTTTSRFDLTYSRKIKSTKMDVSLSQSFQTFKGIRAFIQAGNFSSDESGQQSVSNSLDYSTGLGIVQSTQNSSQNHSVSSLSFSTSTHDRFYFDSNFSLGNANSLNGITYGAKIGVDLSKRGNGFITLIKPTLGFGKCAGAFSFFQTYNPGSIMQAWQLPSVSSTLKPEFKSEVEVGLQWAFKNRVYGNIDFFSATTKDVISITYEYNPGTAVSVLKNAGEIKNKGLEVDLNWIVIDTKTFSLKTSLNFSTIINKFSPGVGNSFSFPPPESIRGQSGTTYFSFKEGASIGQIEGYTYKGIQDGKWVFEDRSPDGVYDNKDQQLFAKPLPTSYLGWTSLLEYKNFRANIFFRSALGHTLFNAYRFSYENPINLNYYNVPSSVLYSDVKTLTESNLISDFYAGKASFVKLDNLSLFYDFHFQKGKRILSLQLTAQNLFTISKYKGDPEVRLGYEDRQMFAGFDSQYSYINAKAFTAGLSLKL